MYTFELLAIYVLDESFLSTINDMNDLYIRTTFRLCRVLFKIDYFFSLHKYGTLLASGFL